MTVQADSSVLIHLSADCRVNDHRAMDVLMIVMVQANMSRMTVAI